MITSMHIENFKCFKDFDIKLGPFNVLIGPNDTGKTAFLQAVRLIGAYSEAPDWKSARTPLAQIAGASKPVAAAWQENASSPIVIVARSSKLADPTPVVHKLDIEMPSGSVMNHKGLVIIGKPVGIIRPDNRRIGRPEYYRFAPSSLRRPSPLAQEMSETGEGFAAFLDNINRDDPDAFKALQESFCARFRYYSKVEVVVVKHNPHNLLALKFHTMGGQALESSLVSDGVILSLAFLALAHRQEHPVILLVEEPENGVHHASLKEIVETLKHLSDDKGVQVILTTHSPYLLDHVEADQVHVFTKDREEGFVTAKRLSDFEGAEEISEMFSTGEKWSLLAEKYGI